MPERGDPRHLSGDPGSGGSNQDAEDFEAVRRRKKYEEEQRKEQEAVEAFMRSFKELRGEARKGRFREQVFASDGPGGRYEADNVLPKSILAGIAYQAVSGREDKRIFPGSREIGIQYHPREEYFYPWHDPEKDQGEIYFLDRGELLLVGNGLRISKNTHESA